VAGYSSSSGSSGSEQSGFMRPSSKHPSEVERSEGSGSRRMWPTRVAKFLSSCSGNLGSSGEPSARLLTASSLKILTCVRLCYWHCIVHELVFLHQGKNRAANACIGESIKLCASLGRHQSIASHIAGQSSHVPVLDFKLESWVQSQ